MPFVSILLPVYNALPDLARALKSLLAQTFTDFEIVAIDDGSTDGSGDWLEQVAQQDNRLRVFHQSNAGALGKVLNRAAELAQGKYLARQDADDLSDMSRLYNQVEYLEAHRDVGLCGTWTWYIDATLGPLFSLEIPDNHTLLTRYIHKGMNPLVHGSVMFRADTFRKTGGYRGSYAEDYDLWIRMSEITKLGICTSVGYYYWRSIGGISAGAHLRQRLLNQLALKLHAERIKFGHEITNWQNEYHKVLSLSPTESAPLERQTYLYYSRGLQLMRRQKFDEARTNFKLAASGQGIYAQKAKRNLTIFGFAPALSIFYRILESQEPFHFARRLPYGAKIPTFN